MRRNGLLLFSAACVLSGSAILAARERDLPVVPNVNLQRYAGRWYEIARLPNRFQRKCAGDVTATYTPQADGKIQVVNTCRQADGKQSKIEGVARLLEKGGSTAKLKVRFFWPFSGDYWIVALDDDYRWAVVGTPDRKYLWFLSRTPALSSSTYQQLLEKVRVLGFDIDKIRKTAQHA